MADVTTNIGLPYPEGADPANVAADIQALAEEVDVKVMAAPSVVAFTVDATLTRAPSQFVEIDFATSKTATLPASPVDGDVITFSDVTGDLTPSNKLTVAPNGKNIDGSSSDFVVHTARTTISLRYNGTEWNVVYRSPVVDVQTFTAGGTWRRPSGCTAIQVVIVDGGGGGQGCSSASASGGAGGRGGMLLLRPSDVGATESVVIGTGGAGSSGGSAGGDGGKSYFGSLGLWSRPKVASGSYSAVAEGGSAGGANGGSGGGMGGFGTRLGGSYGGAGQHDASAFTSGLGDGNPLSSGGGGGASSGGGGGIGSGVYGSGGSGTPSSGNGGDATGYGGGGGGAYNGTGGAGSDGIVVVTTYF